MQTNEQVSYVFLKPTDQAAGTLLKRVIYLGQNWLLSCT